jgi:hypothetical protein
MLNDTVSSYVLICMAFQCHTGLSLFFRWPDKSGAHRRAEAETRGRVRSLKFRRFKARADPVSTRGVLSAVNRGRSYRANPCRRRFQSLPLSSPSVPMHVGGPGTAVACLSSGRSTRSRKRLACLTEPAMAIPPGTYRERLRVHEEHEARAAPLRPAHTVPSPPHFSRRGTERCDQPTDRFLASTAALNTFNGSC